VLDLEGKVHEIHPLVPLALDAGVLGGHLVLPGKHLSGLRGRKNIEREEGRKTFRPTWFLKSLKYLVSSSPFKFFTQIVLSLPFAAKERRR
jgi:hypothetical protein